MPLNLPFSQPRNYPRAASLALVAFAAWVVSDALLKLARTQGVALGEILLICGTGGMVVILLVSSLRGKIDHLRPHRPKGLLVLGMCQLMAFACWMMALPHLPLANMYVVSFLTPMAVACMAAVILKESLGWKRAAAIATGFAGVVITVNPANLFQSGGTWLPYLFLFGHMTLSATQMFLLRVVADKEKSECTAFYPRGIVALGGLVICGLTGTAAMKPWVFLILCASGALGGIGWALIAEAYKNAPAAAVAPFQYSQIICGALLGYLFWSDVPSVYLLCGSAIIIASGLVLVRQERRASRMMVRVE